MSKLIYSPTSTLLEGTYNGIKNRDQAVNPVFYSVAFTGDGFIYTHGRKFRLFNVVDDEVEGLIFQIQNGTAGFYIDGVAIGTGTVVQSVQGDNIVTASTSNGEVTLGHGTFLTQQQAGQYGSATQIPILTVNETGHITAIQNSGTIDISKIRADASQTTGYYHPVGVTNNTLQNPIYNSNLYFDENGNLYVNNLYVNSTALSGLFAPLSHTSVYADGTTYGHVKLSDEVDIAKDVDEHYAATPKAVNAGIAAANQYSQDLFAAQDAMVFVGTINANGIITSHNPVILPTAIDDTTGLTYLDYKVGWTFRFIQAGTFNGVDVEVGDMLIAVHAKGSEFDIDDWTVIQTNISGALTANSNLNGLLYANNSRVVNALALSNGILKYNGTSLEFVNPNTTWRTIQVNSVSIGTNVLNLIPGNAINLTNVDGAVTVAVNASNIIQTSSALTLEQGLTSFSYRPTANATLTIGDLLTLEQDQNEDYVLRHASGTTFTNIFGRISTDAYGHITAVSEVTTLPNPYSLTIKANSTTAVEYDGSTSNKVLVFKDGGDLAFTASTDLNGNSVITPEVTHKYRGVQFYTDSTSNSPVSLLANTVNTVLTLVGGVNVSLTNKNALNEDLPAGTLMINAEDTWRSIEAYRFQSNSLARASIGTSALYFGDDFIMSNNELGLMWTEIDDQGRVTYVN